MSMAHWAISQSSFPRILNNMNQTVQKSIMERLAKLLAESPLAEKIKKSILNKLDQLPDFLIFDLLDVLEKESGEMDRIALEADLFLKQQGEDWKKVEEIQEAAVDDLVGQEFKKIEDNFNLAEARAGLVTE